MCFLPLLNKSKFSLSISFKLKIHYKNLFCCAQILFMFLFRVLCLLCVCACFSWFFKYKNEPPREDNYLVPAVSKVTTTSNISTYTVNMIVNNTLDDLLSFDDTRSAIEDVAVAFSILILWIFIFLAWFLSLLMLNKSKFYLSISFKLKNTLQKFILLVLKYCSCFYFGFCRNHRTEWWCRFFCTGKKSYYLVYNKK